jgi:hypothetical protein
VFPWRHTKLDFHLSELFQDSLPLLFGHPHHVTHHISHIPTLRLLSQVPATRKVWSPPTLVFDTFGLIRVKFITESITFLKFSSHPGGKVSSSNQIHQIRSFPRDQQMTGWCVAKKHNPSILSQETRFSVRPSPDCSLTIAPASVLPPLVLTIPHPRSRNPVKSESPPGICTVDSV